MANYFWILQLSSTTDPTEEQIVNGLEGSGASATYSGSVNGDTVGTFSLYNPSILNGLTSGAEYSLFWVYTDGSLYSSIAKYTFIAENVQLVTPDQDISSGSWVPSTGTDLYAVIDESDFSDTDYISVSGASTAEIGLSTGIPPNGGDIIIRYRAKNDGSGGLTVDLYQGATLKASQTPVLTSDWVTFTWNLTSGEIASITDYSDLRIKFTSS